MVAAVAGPALGKGGVPAGPALSVAKAEELPARAPGGTAPAQPVVLDVRDVSTYFYTYDGVVRALDGVSFKLRRGETLGLVGETGCGKSVTAFSITRLVADPPGRIVSGKILFRGANLLWGIEREATYRAVRGTKRVRVRRRFRRIKSNLQRMAAVRGSGVAMIFQEPSQAMNPVFSIADQFGEVLYLHRGVEIVEALLAADAASRPPEEARRGRPPRGVREDGAVGAGGPGTGAAGPGPGLGARPGPGAGTVPAPGPTAGPAVSGLAGGSAAGGLATLLEELAAASSRENRAEVRAAARKVAELVHLPSLEPELFAVATKETPGGANAVLRLRRRVGRVHLSSLQRGFLRRELQRLKIERGLRQVYFDELRGEHVLASQRRRLKAAHLRLGILRAPYRFWGIGRRVDRPVRNELFWQTVSRLEGVQIANPDTVAAGYPHELSGGMVQRVMIAMTLSIDPNILLADEPTTALDVTIQAQVLELMRHLKETIGTAIVLITHDLAVIAEVADRVCVMYAGQIVETAPVDRLFAGPLHPYTRGLLASIPRLDRPDKELASIPGSVPDLIDPPNGCRFHPRCPHAMPICSERRPPMTEEGDRHQVACFLYHGPEVRE